MQNEPILEIDLNDPDYINSPSYRAFIDLCMRKDIKIFRCKSASENSTIELDVEFKCIGFSDKINEIERNLIDKYSGIIISNLGIPESLLGGK